MSARQELERFGWAMLLIVTTAMAIVVMALLLAPPADAAHCDDDSATVLVPACEPNHVHVDLVAPELGCDSTRGLRALPQDDGTTVCVLEVQAEPEMFQALVFGGAAGLLVVTATLFVNAARKG